MILLFSLLIHKKWETSGLYCTETQAPKAHYLQFIQAQLTMMHWIPKLTSMNVNTIFNRQPTHS